jgi:hypothetical protein|nr:MAG TPA: Transcription initiation factor TFIID subunit, DNA, Nuclear [Inoviridae sp.]
MRGLLKFLFLVSSFCLNLSSALINDDGKSFSELLNDPYRGYNRGKDWGFPYKSDYSTTLLNSNMDNISYIGSNEYGDEFFRIDNKYYLVSQKGDFIFNLRHKTGFGYNLYDYAANRNIFILQYYSSEFEQAKIKCWVDGNYVQTCGSGLSSGSDETFSYFNQWYIEYKATCDSSKNETFSKKYSRCATCPSGQSWDDESGKCFVDCSDPDKNKWGFTNGSCADCSGEKDSYGVKKCYCNFIGSKPPVSSVELKKGDFRLASCENGSQFWYKVPGTPDSDNNNTKPDNPNPGDKPNPGGDNGGGGGNPGGDSGGGSGGGNGGGGGGNGGGKEDKPNPNPGTGDNPGDKPNPNPNPGGGSGGGNGGGDKDKDGNAKFNERDFDYSGLKNDMDNFKSQYKSALDGVVKDLDGFKNGVDQFINNIQGNGLASIDKQSKPTTCVKKYDIEFFGYASSIEFDFCKVASTVSGAFYYIFYAFFFYCFLILIVKILLFAF